MKFLSLVIGAVMAAKTSAAGTCRSSASFGDDERITIRNYHNGYRSLIARGKGSGYGAAAAANMQSVVYKCELEANAQAWAEQCNSISSGNAHSPKTKDYKKGENIYQSGSTSGVQSNFELAVSSWFQELYDYSLSSTRYGSGMSSVGHFTQVVWGKTNAIGCGWADCGTFKNIVCQYTTPGNFHNELIYELGDGCTGGGCTKGTCDHATKLCVGGETDDLAGVSTSLTTPWMTSPDPNCVDHESQWCLLNDFHSKGYCKLTASRLGATTYCRKNGLPMTCTITDICQKTCDCGIPTTAAGKPSAGAGGKPSAGAGGKPSAGAGTSCDILENEFCKPNKISSTNRNLCPRTIKSFMPQSAKVVCQTYAKLSTPTCTVADVCKCSCA